MVIKRRSTPDASEPRHYREPDRFRQLPPDSDPLAHAKNFLLFAHEGHRNRYPTINGRRLLRDYLISQHAYKKFKSVEEQLTSLFAPLFAQRLSTLTRRNTTLAELETWVRTITHIDTSFRHHDYVPRESTPEEDRAQIVARNRQLMQSEREDRQRQLKELITELRTRSGTITPYGFARRYARQARHTLPSQRFASREEFVSKTYGFASTELIDTDVPTNRWVLAKQLEELSNADETEER